MEPLAEFSPTESVPAGRRPEPEGAAPPDGMVQSSGTDPPDGTPLAGRDQPPDFSARLAALCQDGAIRRFAMKLAANRELAEDAIQETYCAIATMRNPTSIDDLRRYFCRVLRNQVTRLSKQAGAWPAPAGDLDAVLAATAGGSRRTLASQSPCEERGMRVAQATAWLKRLDRTSATSVPGRSDNPRRYQEVIVATARWVLDVLLEGGVSTADLNRLLSNQFPEWFGATRLTPDTYHKRLSRARQDVCELLASVIGRDELLP